MPNNSSPTTTITTQGGTATVLAGYNPGGTITASLTNFSAAVIAKGSTVGGVAGTYTSDANAIASQILSGLYAYVNGVKLTGTMPNQGSPTFTPNGTTQTGPAGYYSGLTVNPSQKFTGSASISSNVLTLTFSQPVSNVFLGWSNNSPLNGYGPTGWLFTAYNWRLNLWYSGTYYINMSSITGLGTTTVTITMPSGDNWNAVPDIAYGI
jgi:hypothetical protein